MLRKTYKSVEHESQTRIPQYFKTQSMLESLIQKNKECIIKQQIENDSELSTKSVLDILMSTAKQNSKKLKGGHRFDDVIKMFTSYIKMLGGTLTYETIYPNLPLVMPSPSSVNRYIKDYGPTIIEGVLRTQDLRKYLDERKLPLIVWLSEDATKITPRIQYDSATNQLVGFVLPFDNNVMPIPYSFKAGNAKQIEEHFQKEKQSSMVYAVMAQPLKENVPAFCLQLFGTDNKFSGDNVLNRWRLTKEKLNEVRISKSKNY